MQECADVLEEHKPSSGPVLSDVDESPTNNIADKPPVHCNGVNSESTDDNKV